MTPAQAANASWYARQERRRLRADDVLFYEFEHHVRYHKKLCSCRFRYQ